MELKTIKTFDQWLDDGYLHPKGDSVKEWNQRAKAIKGARVDAICERLNLGAATISCFARGQYLPNERYMEAIVELAGEPIAFQAGKQIVVVSN